MISGCHGKRTLFDCITERRFNVLAVFGQIQLRDMGLEIGIDKGIKKT